MKHPAPLLPAREPLTAVPRIPHGVTATATPSGLLVARTFALHGFRGWAIRRLGGSLAVRVELDDRGAYFWGQVDGRRPLAAIADDLQARFSLAPSAARTCTIEFTKQLMRRNLLELEIAP